MLPQPFTIAVSDSVASHTISDALFGVRLRVKPGGDTVYVGVSPSVSDGDGFPVEGVDEVCLGVLPEMLLYFICAAGETASLSLVEEARAVCHGGEGGGIGGGTVLFDEPFNVGWTGAGVPTDPVFTDPADFDEPFNVGWTGV